MSTVREATYELWRKHGMTTMFGNPGSTELPMLADFPDDFRYVLGLHETVAVGMADGYAQASGTVGHVNLHTAPGVGNGMGAIFNAQANHTPLLVTAGQQVRPVITMQANLTNRDATRVVHPLVKWSYEPPRAEDVPAAIARGIHTAAMAPKGPAFVSIPMDDWTAEAPGRRDRARDRAHRQPARRRRSRRGHGARRTARQGRAPGAGRGTGHRRLRRLGRRGRDRRERSGWPSGRFPRPVAAGSASPRITPCSRARCPRRSRRSRRCSAATT